MGPYHHGSDNSPGHRHHWNGDYQNQMFSNGRQFMENNWDNMWSGRNSRYCMGSGMGGSMGGGMSGSMCW
jgi:hypothetical protein